MVKKIKNFLKKLSVHRTTVLMIVFAGMFCILIQRLFQLQILSGQEYAENFNLRTTKELTLNATRGNIYDRNGNVLASNKLSYSITLEDNGTYDSTREKNLTLNSVAYEVLQILQANENSIDHDFHIILDENGEYAFDVTGTSLQRFRADVYGHASIDDLKETEEEATPNEIMAYLSGNERFALTDAKKPYTSEELTKFSLPESFTPQETLDIVTIRYALSTNSFRRYVPVTIASNVNENTVAIIMENKDRLQGIDIAQDTIRAYEDSIYFAPIIGYTGKASTEELDELKKESDNYNSTSIIGKTGIEQYMETYLQGINGSRKVYVDNLGKVLKTDDDSVVEPQSGNDVYLTIDKELQIAAYKVLEQHIAGIVSSMIQNIKDFDRTNVDDTATIPIPIYDVYFALINNSVIDIGHFTEEGASETEQELYARFEEKQAAVFESIRQELTGEAPAAYKDLDKEMQEYISYIVNELLMTKTGILSEDAIDKTDATYIAWTTDESISLQEYLTYAASQNWIDISKISTEGAYLDSSEVYHALAAYLEEALAKDTAFSKLLYKYMLQSDTISGRQVCTILYDQGVLSTDDSDYEPLISGRLTAYDFMKSKINKLEITPAQLALDPCSGSLVATDPNTGEILACVTYPGYDNNRLANQMDTAYYNALAADLSQPFYNKATQQRTAPGSTFKIVTAVAGLEEGIITDDFGVDCTGIFNKAGYSIRCWNHGGHGWLGLQSAIKESCNVFFDEVGYRLGLDSEENFSESLGLEKLEQYASLFDLDKNSGIEISEASPQISDKNAVPSYIGQGTHNYTTSQLARYVTTIANSGTSYNISLLDKVTDSDGNVLEDFTPEVQSTIDLRDSEWNTIHAGMRQVVQNNEAFNGMNYSVAGKTGTAQQSKSRPSHGLFIGYAPVEEPQLALAVRIANGYSSANAASVAREVISYKFDLQDEASLLTGTASSYVGTSQTD
ncbi:penicillin-binding transpeptidase domain-containing protein [Lactonifactor longoviformis]|uniref:penicillin-binding transpeptidase domain-containing protein n=1 Tax=Lactonifactor longoviformis TaxID=341220 RepID=UPI001D005496|nr:penicillin-binding transpeptidase domain-containing protein [Lactonifactor longoviformis]MCB5714068.1 peptidase [Lactonifactor longoviformis]MCB5718091.1 peptidase [Lactonifactor longoviformis]MCQ4671738.1 penicillin-binding transpeptidase domain-containing protein [Lactonifactor longoviformis]